MRELAERVRDGLDVVGVPTSTATRDLALELGIRLADLNDLPELDVTIDGARGILFNITGGQQDLDRRREHSRPCRRRPRVEQHAADRRCGGVDLSLR